MPPCFCGHATGEIDCPSTVFFWFSERKAKGLGVKAHRRHLTGTFASQSLLPVGHQRKQTAQIKCQGHTLQTGKEEPLEGQILKFTLIIETKIHVIYWPRSLMPHTEDARTVCWLARVSQMAALTTDLTAY